MEFTENISLDEEKVIDEIIIFLKEFGCTGEYNRVLVDEEEFLPKVIYYFKNPGWSINRSIRIKEKLIEHLLDFFESNGMDNLLRDIFITFD